LSAEDEKRVILQEVSLRDGLQNESRVLEPRVRVDLARRLADAGLPRIQIGSFVNPTLVPQMAGTDELWRLLPKKDGVRYSVLVLNERGLDQALEAGIPHVEIFVSASETHSIKNANVSVDKALTDASRMIRRAHENQIGVTAGVMCAFGCFYEGGVSVERVLELVAALGEASPSEIGLADTTGMGTPEHVETLLNALEKKVRLDHVTLHLHDTRGLALANVRAALQMGVRRFDSSVAGLGGCPFIPGAPGNLSTEKTVETLHSLGFETGVDVDAVRRIGIELEILLSKTGRP
jgi:hydroxymethylglutaryl-CoA lyase